MAQLIVRNLEDKVVRKLKERAAKYGVSMEEEHRRILRAELVPKKRKPKLNFKEYLLTMPNVGDDSLFERSPRISSRSRSSMSFLLDTNVISELRKQDKCNRGVRNWFQDAPFEDLFISVMTTAELRRGVEKCRITDIPSAIILERWLNGIQISYESRILPITEEISDIWGRLSAQQPVPILDGFIAATAIYYGFTVITRNESDFQRIGIDFFNPFTGGKP